MRQSWTMLSVAALAAVAASGGSAQQNSNGATFGDWRLACDAVAVNRTRCEIRQTLTIRDSGELLAQVALTSVDKEGIPRTALVLTTPTGMFLPMAPGMSIDDGDDTLPLQWRTCDANRCVASRVLEAAEVAALRAGSRLTLGYSAAAASEPVIFPVSLRGVSAGLDALSE